MSARIAMGAAKVILPAMDQFWQSLEGQLHSIVPGHTLCLNT